MYFLKNKEQLNNIVLELRKSIATEYGSAPKSQKFRELVADCIGYNSYAALLAELNNNYQFYLEDHEEDFHIRLSSALTSEPYGYATNEEKILSFYNELLDQYASWDEEANYHSIIMASE